VHVLKSHRQPVTHIKYNDSFKTVVSIDQSGMIEYWSSEDPWYDINYPSFPAQSLT
jgi:hypothetical protein